MTAEIPRPGDKECTRTPSPDLLSGHPWILIPRPPLRAPAEERTPAQTPEDVEQPTKDFLAARLMGMNRVESLPPEVLQKIFPITDSQKPEQAEVVQTEAPRREDWILRYYALLGLAEVKKRFPRGTFSAIAEYWKTRHISDIDSPNQNPRSTEETKSHNNVTGKHK